MSSFFTDAEGYREDTPMYMSDFSQDEYDEDDFYDDEDDEDGEMEGSGQSEDNPGSGLEVIGVGGSIHRVLCICVKADAPPAPAPRNRSRRRARHFHRARRGRPPRKGRE